MFEYNNTTKERKNKHLKYADRQNIEYWLKEGISIREIAKLLGKCKKTIYLEMKRGSVTKYIDSKYKEIVVYKAKVAQEKYEYNLKAKGSNMILDFQYELHAHIEKELLIEKKSPEVIAHQLENYGFEKKSISAKTIRNSIKKGLFLSISPEKIIYNKKEKVSKNIEKRRSKTTPPEKSIENRPKKIEKRLEYGHWEGDLVIGERKKGACLFVLTERMTREEIILKIPNKTTESVVSALDFIEKNSVNFNEKFKTITFDNGSEFKDYIGMEKSVFSSEKRTFIYYAHPYCSGERASNENNNKFIRRFIPKGTSIDEIPLEKIKFIQNWINNYPRKIFGYLSSNEFKKLLCLSC